MQDIPKNSGNPRMCCEISADFPVLNICEYCGLNINMIRIPQLLQTSDPVKNREHLANFRFEVCENLLLLVKFCNHCSLFCEHGANLLYHDKTLEWYDDSNVEFAKRWKTHSASAAKLGVDQSEREPRIDHEKEIISFPALIMMALRSVGPHTFFSRCYQFRRSP